MSVYWPQVATSEVLAHQEISRCPGGPALKLSNKSVRSDFGHVYDHDCRKIFYLIIFEIINNAHVHVLRN